MPRKYVQLMTTRRLENEDMFVSKDTKSLRRGRRRVPRTEVCRPCLVWTSDHPEEALEGVILDLNPYGIRIRMLDELAPGTSLQVQLMRDEEYTTPLSPPIDVNVVRTAKDDGPFVDHGVRVVIKEIERLSAGKPVRIPLPRLRRSGPTRMNLADYIAAARGMGRSGRNRG